MYIRNIFFLAKLTDTPFLDGVYWTLYIELQFYLLVAFLLSFKKWKQLMDIAVCGLFVITWYNFLTAKQDWWFGAYSSTFLNSGWALSLGRAFAGVASKTRTKLNWAGLILGMPLLFYLQWHEAVRRKTDPMVVMKIILAMILFFFVVPNFKFKLGKKTEKVVIFLGGVSYPLYLFHHHFNYEYQTQYSLTTWQTFGIIPIACIIHEFLEKPFVSLITRCLRTARTETRTELRTEPRTEPITDTRTETKAPETGDNINIRIGINSYGSIN
jgi:peptidoglycan/LPS O-acetylase OafA/YrhL